MNTINIDTGFLTKNTSNNQEEFLSSSTQKKGDLK